MKKSVDCETAAIVTIKDAARMTKRGRERIAQWLERHAKDLRELGSEYSGRFIGRYYYRSK